MPAKAVVRAAVKSPEQLKCCCFMPGPWYYYNQEMFLILLFLPVAIMHIVWLSNVVMTSSPLLWYVLSRPAEYLKTSWSYGIWFSVLHAPFPWCSFFRWSLGVSWVSNGKTVSICSSLTATSIHPMHPPSIWFQRWTKSSFPCKLS